MQNIDEKYAEYPPDIRKRLSKRDRRLQRQKNKAAHGGNIAALKAQLKEISARTENQQSTIDSYDRNKNLVLHGAAGTGKTFMLTYLALEEIIQDNTFERLKIIRSIVPTRDIGFLPGSPREKIRMYEAPYASICTELFSGRTDAYELLKSKGMIDFEPTSFLRGNTFDNCIVLVDEFQNLSWHEINSTITRMGENSKILFAGDLRQTDLIYDKEKAGAAKFLEIVKRMKSFDLIQFNEEDIVRSKLVKEFIISSNRYEDEQHERRARAASVPSLLLGAEA
jgi:phosphate starvation-inducible protein PhoH